MGVELQRRVASIFADVRGVLDIDAPERASDEFLFLKSFAEAIERHTCPMGVRCTNAPTEVEAGGIRWGGA